MRWFRHVQWRHSEYIVRRMLSLEEDQRRIIDGVNKDIKTADVRVEDADGGS